MASTDPAALRGPERVVEGVVHLEEGAKAGDLEDPADGIGCDHQAKRRRPICASEQTLALRENSEAARVEEAHLGQVHDDDVRTPIGTFKGVSQERRRR